MSAKVAARVQACLRGFWDRQRSRARTRKAQLAASLAGDLPVNYSRRHRFPIQIGIPPTFETPRTHHAHIEIKEARRAHPS